MDEHLAEFIASSVLAAIMTYANWRLSAGMRLFSKKKKKKEDACTTKMEGGRKWVHLTFVVWDMLNARYHGAPSILPALEVSKNAHEGS